MMSGSYIRTEFHRKNHVSEDRLSKLIKEAKRYMPLFPQYGACMLYMLYAPIWNADNGITLCSKCHLKTASHLRTKKGKNR